MYKYVIQYSGNPLTKHRILGEDEYLPELKGKAIKIMKSILIINNSNDTNEFKIMGSTIPHAGFIYSGLLALLTIIQIIESNDSDTLTILWFKHNPDNDTEHSLKNITVLCKLLYPEIRIKPIEITQDTDLDDIQINTPLLVSTDFSHHNYSKSDSDLYDVLENDSLLFNNENKSNKNQPCGKEPLRIFKELTNESELKIKLQAYSNSESPENWWKEWEKKKFEGVTYANISAINDNSWFSELKSKLLAYSHLKWVEEYLLSPDNVVDKGLYWSPLKNISGSSFVTIYYENKETYSCFGSWEPDNKNILESIKNASRTVKEAKWHIHEPVNRNTIKNILKNNYIISITLIEPIKNWIKADTNNINNNPRNRGYVYYNKINNKVGMTYLPSVWDSFNTPNDFFKGLIDKHTNVYSTSSEWDLYMYESISWELKI